MQKNKALLLQVNFIYSLLMERKNLPYKILFPAVLLAAFMFSQTATSIIADGPNQILECKPKNPKTLVWVLESVQGIDRWVAHYYNIAPGTGVGVFAENKDYYYNTPDSKQAIPRTDLDCTPIVTPSPTPAPTEIPVTVNNNDNSKPWWSSLTPKSIAVAVVGGLSIDVLGYLLLKAKRKLLPKVKITKEKLYLSTELLVISLYLALFEKMQFDQQVIGLYAIAASLAPVSAKLIELGKEIYSKLQESET